MVFKSRQVQIIPVVIFLFTIVYSLIFFPLIAVFGIIDPTFYVRFMSLLMGVFLIMFPVLLPLMIAADSIIGEKERNTLIPLLKTPLSNAELLLGKHLTALIPGILVTYTNFIIAIFTINLIALFSAPMLLGLWPMPILIIQILVLPPFFASFSVSIMIMISERVDRVAEAYQFGSIVIIIPMFLVFASFFLNALDNLIIFSVMMIILVIATLVAFQIARKKFNRDKLLTN